MSKQINNTTITTFKGDTCSVTFKELDEDMVIYFSVRDTKTNEPVFDELRGVVDSVGEVTFTITPEMSNKFEVEPSQGINIYYYGLKQVDEETGEENTILLGDNPKFCDKYYIKVLLKKAEGLIEEEEDGED